MNSYPSGEYNYPQSCTASTTVPFEITSDYVDSTTFDVRQGSTSTEPLSTESVSDSRPISPLTTGMYSRAAAKCSH